MQALALAVFRNQYQERSAYDLVTRISVEPFSAVFQRVIFMPRSMPSMASLDEAMIAAR